MKTYFLGKEEIACYIADLADRLVELKSDFPLLWCAIGPSGESIANELLQAIDRMGEGTLLDKIQIALVSYDKDAKNVVLTDDGDQRLFSTEGNVLVIDSSVHSGASMLSVVNSIRDWGSKSIISYSLVVKRNASFVPNFFGLIIGDHDRALFLLDKFPNNRLCQRPPFGTLRTLSADDISHKRLDAGVPSLDKLDWGDLYYEKVAKGAQVYVFETDKSPSAFISFKLIRDAVLLVDAVVVDSSLQGKGIGGVLIRWAENWARSMNCAGIELWSKDDRVDWYQKQDFEVVNGKILDLGEEKYQLMNRRLLYNLSDPKLAA